MFFYIFTTLLLPSSQCIANSAELNQRPEKVLRQKITVPAEVRNLRFDFQNINVAQVIQLIYSEALKSNYVLDPEVLLDNRSVSFRYEERNGDLRTFFALFLGSLGYGLESKNGVHFISKIKPAESVEAEHETLIYSPKFRDVSYLSRLLAPLFKGTFSVNRIVSAPEGSKVQTNVPDGSAASMIDQNASTLIFYGTEKEVDKLRK